MGFGSALFLTAVLSINIANGKPESVVEAEHQRIAHEMKNLIERQIWSGVERKFGQMQRLGCELTFDDYVNGAYAARELGDVMSVYLRLKEAIKLGDSKEVIDWLWDIDNNYGRVELFSVPAKSTDLTVSQMPFDPTQRKAVDAAIESAQHDGIFHGMLPRGEYQFAGQSFTVEPGLSVRIEVSPRLRRKGIKENVIVTH